MTIALVLGLAVFGLHVPLASTVTICALGAAAVVSLGRQGRVSSRLVLRAALLTVGVVSYYLATVSFAFVGPADAAKYVTYCVAAYVTGFWLARVRGGQAMPGGYMVVMAAAMVVFAGLSVGDAGASAAAMGEADRAARNFWKPGEWINAPAVGVMGSLAMCLGAAGLFGLSTAKWANATVWVLIAAVLPIGVYVNVVLQNRGPFIAAALAAVLAAGFFLWREGARRPVATGIAVAGIGLVLAWAVAALLESDGLESLGVYQRFSAQGLETPRYYAWGKVLAEVWSHPLGGRTIDISPVRYAHNLWLDVGWEAGVVPFLALLVFHALHVGPIARVLRRRVTVETALWLIGLLVAYLAAFMTEPILAADTIYFSASCMLFGAFLGADRVDADSARAVEVA